MNLDNFFSPHSVAVVGASQEAARIGGRLIRYLVRHGFAGDIYPVNPKYDHIAGLTCYAALADIKPAPDMVLIAVPEKAVAAVLAEARACRIKNAIVYSSGFSETGAEGRLKQEKIRSLALAAGMRVCGPNCVGIINFHDRMAMSFSQFLETSQLIAGPVAFISQSGALGGSLLNRAQDDQVGFSHFVSTGNEAVLEASDFIDYFLTEPRTEVIMAVLEGIRDADKFLQVCDRARDVGKPLIVMKLGRTQAGVKAAGSHTGSMAGSDEVFDAIFRQKGVVRVNDLEDLYPMAAAMVKSKPFKGKRIGIITSSGGGGIILSDKIIAAGMQLPELSEACAKKLRALVPPYVALNNPLDLTAQLINDPNLFQNVVDVFSADENFDAVVVAASMVAGELSRKRAAYIIQAAGKVEKPLFTWWAAGSLASPGMDMLLKSNVPFFTSARQCVQTLKALAWHAESKREVAPGAPGRATLNAADKGWIEKIFRNPEKTIGEQAGKKILSAYGIPVVKEQLGRNQDEVLAMADRICYPVVLKVVSPDVPHKTESGGVRLNIADERELADAYHDIITSVRNYNARAEITGMLVQEMAEPGIEVILGVKHDRQFGPMVMFGLGGVFVEVFKDVALRRPPFSERDAYNLIEETKASHILKGYRGKKPSDLPALARIVSAVGQLALDWQNRFTEMDINPLVVHPEGHGAKVLDCLFVK